jgi:hypothetical protein
MKKIILGLFLALIISSSGMFADILEDFYNSLDISISFEHLSKMSPEKVAEIEKLIIINGAVSSREIINEDENDFLALIELVNGEWEGMEDVKMYRCFIRLSGPEFFKRIPARRSRKKAENEIELNSRILVIGRVLGSFEENGTYLPVVEALHVRTLK